MELLYGVNEVGVWKCGILGIWNLLLEMPEDQEWLGTPCAVSLPINRPQGTFCQSLVFFLLRGSRIKHEITA